MKSQTKTAVPTIGTNTGFSAVQTYSYDSLNRLKDATENVTPTGGSASQSWKQTFTYDRYGNRNFDEANTSTLLKSCSGSMCAADRKIYNPSINASNNNRMDSGQGYSYDASGNTTADAGSQTYTYDGENKMVEASNGSGPIGQYTYDGDGKRVKKLVPSTGELTVFVYDAAGKQVAEYSTLVANSTDAKVNYLTSDHLGSPRINTDAAGNIIAKHDYHPFGEEIDGTGGRTTGLNYGHDSVRKRFTGYDRDVETSLDYAQARMYEAVHGRFDSSDPMNIGADQRLPQTWNAYTYVVNNPTNGSDPSGLFYLRKGDTIYWADWDWEACQKDAKCKELYKDYEFVPVGTVVTVAPGQTGRYAGLDGVQIKLLAGDKFEAINPPGVESVTTFAPHDKVEQGIGYLLANGSETRLWFWRPVIYTAGTVEMGLLSSGTPFMAAGGGSAVGGGILGLELSGSSSVGTSFSVGTLANFQRIFAQGGKKALERSLRSLQKRVFEHTVDKAVYEFYGGYTSYTAKEIATYQSQIRAVTFLLDQLP